MIEKTKQAAVHAVTAVITLLGTVFFAALGFFIPEFTTTELALFLGASAIWLVGIVAIDWRRNGAAEAKMVLNSAGSIIGGSIVIGYLLNLGVAGSSIAFYVVIVVNFVFIKKMSGYADLPRLVKREVISRV